MMVAKQYEQTTGVTTRKDFQSDTRFRTSKL
jgi:hypothetical protein